MPCFMNSAGLDITTSGEKKYHQTNTGPNVRAWSSSISHNSRPLLSVSSVALPWKKLVLLGPGMWLYCWCRFHRRGTQIKKATSNTTKKMTRVIASNSRLLKFKITESMIPMVTVWNGVTQILLFYAAEQTMNLSEYLKQIIFKTIQLLTKSEFFRSLNVWN